MHEMFGLGGGGALYCPSLAESGSTLFVACDMGGLYRSDDLGGSWDLVDQRYMRGDPGCAVASDRPPSQVVWGHQAFRGLRRSADGGTTWALPEPQAPASVTAIALDTAPPAPGADRRVFVGTSNGKSFYRASPGQWQQCPVTQQPPPGNPVIGIIAAERSPGAHVQLLACRGLLYRPTATGTTWEPRTYPGSGAVRSVSGAAAGGVLRVFVVTTGDQLFYSDDAGGAWQLVPGVPAAAKPRLVATVAGDPDRIYLASFTSTDRLYRSTNLGASWTSVLDSNITEPGWVAADPAFAGFGGAARGLTARRDASGDDTVVFTNLAELYLSTDSGGAWRQRYSTPAASGGWSSRGLEVTTTWRYVIDPHEPARRYICYTDICFARSTDSGTTWRPSRPTLRSGAPTNTIYDLLVDPVPLPSGGQSRLLAAAAGRHDLGHWGELLDPGSGTNQGGVLVSTDSGGTWAHSNGTATGPHVVLPDAPAVSLCQDQQTPTRVWVALWNQGVFRSTDRGQSWLPNSLSPGSSLHVYRLEQRSPDTVYCSVLGRRTVVALSDGTTVDSVLDPGGLWRSLDGGASWAALTNVPAGSAPPGFSTALRRFGDFAVHPTDTQVIYLCTGAVPRVTDPNGSVVQAAQDGAVFITRDGGLSWTELPALTAAIKASGYNPDWVTCFAIQFDPEDPSHSTLHVTTEDAGTWISRDSGATWEEDRSLPFLRGQRLTFDPLRPGTRYLSTAGGGVLSPSDVFLRDFVGDTGARHTGPVSKSPDIIVRASPLTTSPDQAFGQGSGTENDDNLSDPVTPGATHDIYVRARNRGGSDAHDVTVTVYWSEVGTLITPSTWHAIGSATGPTIPANGDLVAWGPIPWSTLPAAPGHYCFIAVISSPREPAPTAQALAGWDAFVALVRNYNNVTWRNFDYGSTPWRGEVVDFLVAGAEDRAVVLRLQAGATVRRTQLDLRLGDLERWRVDPDGEPPRREWRRRARSTTSVDLRLPAGTREPAALQVRFPWRVTARTPQEFWVRQLYGDLEVGRVTWQRTPTLTRRMLPAAALIVAAAGRAVHRAARR